MKMPQIITVFTSLLWLVVAASPASQDTDLKPVPQSDAKASSDEWALRGRLLANPNDKTSHDALCSLLRNNNDYRRLVAERKAWLENNTWDYSELITLTTEADLFLDDPLYAIDVARRFLSRLDLKDAVYGWANDFLGRQLLNSNRFDEAISCFRTALRVEPNREDYLEHLGSALVKADQLNDGIAALKKAIILNPTSLSLHLQLGDAYGRKGDLIGKETEYSAACNLLYNLHKNDPLYSRTDPALSRQLTQLARVQIEHGKYTKANATLNRAIKADPQNFYTHLLRARLLEKQNQPKEAEAYRQKARDLLNEIRKIEKDNSLGMLSQPLIFFVATMYEDFHEIVRIYKASATPLTTADRAMLSIAYFEIGQAADAIVELDKIHAADQTFLDNAKQYFGYAQQLKKANFIQKAEEYYRKAYEMDPENMTYAYQYEAIKKAVHPSK